MTCTDPPMVLDNVKITLSLRLVATHDNLEVKPSYSKTNINDTTRTYFCADILIDFPIKVFF
ncbi:MAG: hypothetical protein IPP49_20065 [Saprospiraceae bacterium]|nr:hypothetical protein [Saprospiraceae bacterium]